MEFFVKRTVPYWVNIFYKVKADNEKQVREQATNTEWEILGYSLDTCMEHIKDFSAEILSEAPENLDMNLDNHLNKCKKLISILKMLPNLDEVLAEVEVAQIKLGKKQN